MLASDTQAISDRIKQSIEAKSSDSEAFANTRDTLCYATNDNQQATMSALEWGGLDTAIVVGGYNSSNTSHLVELCEEKVPTFFVRNEKEFQEDGTVKHFDWRTGVPRDLRPMAGGGRRRGSYTVVDQWRLLSGRHG